jgi:aspartate-semialdehyde dehydrogenase
MRVAVVGATGAVGSTMLEVLRERSFPADEVVPFASERSAGRTLRWGDQSLTVAPLNDESIQGFDVALFSAGSGVSAEWAPRFADAGAVVVDNSSQWRMHEDVPLVVSEVNPEALDGHKGIVANPNCTTMQTVVALGPILKDAGIERLVMSSYQAVSGTGQRAVEELHDQVEAQLHAKEMPQPLVYPHQIAFNVLPQVETFKDGDDYTTEERKCMRGRDLLASSPGLTVIDDPANGLYPTALDAAGRDDVLVGRIRRDPSHDRCLNLWIVGNNLRKGAATNAVQVAELLNVRGLLRAAATRS